MKKSLLILAAFAAAALFSCTEIIVEQPVVDPDGTTVFTPGEGGTHFSFSVIREDPATKSYLSGTDFLWEDGEEISVCYGGSNVKFTYDEATGKFNSDAFDPEAAGPFYVVAPYNAGITIDGSGKIHTELPANQVDKGKGLDPAALLSVGKAADVAALTAGISLKNAFSLVKVAVSDSDVDRISIDGNYSGTGISPLLAGAVTVDPSDGSVVATGRGTSVSLTSAGGNFAAGAYILAVLPQTMTNGIKMVFRRAGEAQSYYRNSSKSISFVRNAGISFAAVSVAGLTKRCYYVNDAADLVAWASVGTFNGTDNIFLGADIDMDGESWTPVDGFAGTFDGQNHRIYNLSVSGDKYVGFIRINKDEDVTAALQNVVFGSKDGENWDGVSNFTHPTSATTDTWYYVGIFAKAQQAAVMKNIVNFSTIEVGSSATGKTRIGSMSGNWASTGKLQDCINYGEVRNLASSVGDGTNGVAGISGVADANTTIQGCINYGTITNNNALTRFVGGILAYSGYTLNIKDCINYGDIVANKIKNSQWGGIGGLVGYCKSSSTVQDCQVINASITSGAGPVVSDKEWVMNIGGAVGYLEAASISNITVSGTTISANHWDVGGLVGISEAAVTISNCHVRKGSSASSVSGVQRVGGVVGYLLSGALTIQNSSIEEATSVIASGPQAGGIVGEATPNNTFKIDNCFCKNSTVQGKHSVAGIMGHVKPTAAGKVYVYNCGVSGSTIFATASDGTPPKGDCMAAGIIGWPQCSTSGSETKVLNCYCYADDGGFPMSVTITTPSVGGIFGYVSCNSAGTFELANCCSNVGASTITLAGTPVTGSTSRVGAIFGMLSHNYDTESVKNCFHVSGKDLDMGELSGGGSNVTFEGNASYAESTFKDGTTVPAQLNTFASGYAGLTLKSWTTDGSGWPVLAE